MPYSIWRTIGSVEADVSYNNGISISLSIILYYYKLSRESIPNNALLAIAIVRRRNLLL